MKKIRSLQVRPDDVNNLSVSEESDIDESGKAFPTVVFLFTPNLKDKNLHWHIQLDLKQAEDLSRWLNNFLKNKRRKTNSY